MIENAGALRAEFEGAHGYWSESLGDMARLDPVFFRAYLDLSTVPHRTAALDPKLRALVNLAIDANATHMFVPGIRRHIARSVELGATDAEIMEVLELSATLGIHAANAGVPILLEVLAETGETPDVTELDARQQQLKADFEANRGYWSPIWDGVLKLSPDFFEAYLEYSSVPWKHGVLEPKVKELIYCAFDCSATHLWLPGLKLHMRNALGYGATPLEIMEVIQIASALGAHAFEWAMPALREARDAGGG
ncbi:MAG TPA: carboxymuconolactone decarboxylase family protein [Ilumatobacter sp.]|nr:carboxymuconolactone decarboxylase family protein [Ilumatobacter sp.]